MDDVSANLELLCEFFESCGYNTRAALDGELALVSARTAPPDLILLDVIMPSIDGYEVCERLKKDPLTQKIPVIFISALDEPMDKVRAFAAGGVDYITKPFHFEEIRARVESQLNLHRQRRHIEDLIEMKDHFLRSVSHDLKNPLSSVLGYIELLRGCNGIIQDDEAQEYTDLLQKNAHRMLNLIGDLLDVIKIEGELNLDRKPVAMSAFLEDCVVDVLFSANKKGLNLRFIPPAIDLVLDIDPDRMYQVMMNLLSNAVKYTPSGGQIEVHVGANHNAGIIEVSDTGLGIPPESIPHLFTKFYRVRTPQHISIEGTGLGLAIVKFIIEQHGGDISVESELGKGSTFTVRLPL